MSFVDSILKITRRAESLLEKNLGAQGRGLHEKVTSVERRVPDHLVKQLRFLATIRNRAVHEDDYDPGDAQGVLRRGDETVAELESLINEARQRAAARHAAAQDLAARRELEARRTATQRAGSASQAAAYRSAPSSGASPIGNRPSPHGRDESRISWAVILAFVLIGVAVIASNDSNPIKVQYNRIVELVSQPEPSSVDAPRTATTPKPSATNSAPRQATPPSAIKPSSSVMASKPAPKPAQPKPAAPAPKPAQVAKAAPKPTPATKPAPTQPPASTADSPQQRFNAGEHVVLSAPGLELKLVKVQITPRLAITVEVHNTTDRYLSRVELDARLYIPGRSSPIAPTRAGATTRMHVRFGDNGLAPGARATLPTSIATFQDYDWSTPDVRNASRHQLVMAIASIYDGSEREMPGGPGLSTLMGAAGITHVSVPAPEPAASAPMGERVARWQAQLDAGNHVAIGSSEIELSDLKVERNRYGNFEFRAKITNLSTRTLSSAELEGRLFINHAKESGLARGKASSRMHARFGDTGLQVGESQTVKIHLATFEDSNWDTPDIRAASHHQVVIRVRSVDDGAGQEFGGAGPMLKGLRG